MVPGAVRVPRGEHRSPVVWTLVALAVLSWALLPLAVAPRQEATTGPISSVGVSPLFSVALSADPTSGTSPLNVTFAASVSGGVPPYSYIWVFGDDNSETGGAIVSHNYTEAGTFTASVTVTDAVGGSSSASVSIVSAAVPPPSSSPDTSWIVLGAVAAAMIGIALGIVLSRRTSGSTRTDDGEDEGGSDVAGTGPMPVAPYRPSYYPPPPPWRPPQYPPAYPSRPYSVYRPPSYGTPGFAGSYRGASLPPAPTPTYVENAGPPSRAPAPPSSLPLPGSPVRPSVPSLSPAVPAPSSPAVAAVPAPAPVPKTAPAVPASPPVPRPSPELQALIDLELADSPPLSEVVRTLNRIPLGKVAEEASRGPSDRLAQAAGRLDPLARSLRSHLQDPDSLRLLLRDITQDWFAASRGGGSAPAFPSDGYRALLAPSRGSDQPSLLERLGKAAGELSWTAVGRAAPWLLVMLVVFAGVEAAAFAGLYLSFHDRALTPFDSLVVPGAVLGPPALVLLLYPVAEWGLVLLRHFRTGNSTGRLFSLSPVRIASYLVVLALAEISRVVADLVSASLFSTPSSLLVGGQVSAAGVLGFLAVISATLFLGWAAVASWNLGGTRRVLLSASLLYLAVVGVLVGGETRILVDLAQGPTWATVAQVQNFLWVLPVFLLVSSFFVIMLFVAFSEPEWMRSHAASTRWRAQVGQAFLDDLAARPATGASVPLDRLSDLGRGNGAPRVSGALRDLFAYDADRDRYVVLRWHDAASDTLLNVHIRGDASGPYYVLDTENLALPAAASAASGSAPGAAAAPGSMDDLWTRTDLCDGPAWLKLLQDRKGGPRLPRPPSEARSGPTCMALLQLLVDPGAAPARDLFRKVGWTKPSGPMLLVQLIQSGEKGVTLVPDIETDGEYLEVELNRLTGHADDAASYLGPWALPAWNVTREVVMAGGSGHIEYRAVRTPSAGPAGTAPPAASS